MKEQTTKGERVRGGIGAEVNRGNRSFPGKVVRDNHSRRHQRLREANLRPVILHEARLSQADLHRTELSLADLHHADLDGANLYGASLRGRIAAEYGVPVHRIDYVLATRPHIQPVAKAGTLRLFDQHGKNLIRAELEQIDAKASEASDGIAAERGDADAEGTRK
jgi:uncharacterized protein YjbI with pentapeptide repeats